MSDDTDSNVVHLPARDDDSGAMPEAPDIGDLFYSEPPDNGAVSGTPPESPEETTMEIPAIRAPISPETALRETGMPGVLDSGGEAYGEGEYVQPHSLADRLGDWLEFRLEVARDRHAGEASFREAEIARKTALLEARTARETALMEQNGKLHAAMMKAKADKAAARGKADADRTRSSSSGMGADKGRSKASGGGASRAGSGSSGGSGRGADGSRSSGTKGTGGGGTGRGHGGGNAPKGAGKGSDRSAGGRSSGSKGNESSAGSKGRQNGSGAPGSGKGGAGKGSSGDGSKAQYAPASSPAAERARGRQERAAARQAARQQQRSANQAAGLADRSKDRDQDRANRQAAWEERRAAKAERKAERKAKQEAAKAAADRTTLGAAVAEEAQRRWDKRRAAAEKDKAAQDGEAKDSTGDSKDASGDKDSEATTKKRPNGGPEMPSDGPDGDSATTEPGEGNQADEKPSDGSSSDKEAKGGTGTADGSKPDDVKDSPGAGDSGGRSFKERLKGFFGKAAEDNTRPEAEEPPRTARPEDFKVTFDSPGHSSSPPKPEPAEEEIPDAVIVDDPSDPFGAHVTSPASLPRAPEPHTQRPGTTGPTAQEDSVASEVTKSATGQAGLAAKHRTDITFDKYLMEIADIAVAASSDKERAEQMAGALGKVADALRDMATDLVGDHNIATEVTTLISDLADAAARMKAQAERCATECETASEAATLVAMAVARTYGEDLQAMDDAGLAHASSAAHHD
ncbi:ATP/GTP-binding protein [Streptomyces globosus]|uniref:ATP/GTP-binding protein n=1 Tax=Streptomyces globosus TaxID=68209 RepID=UPI0031DA4C4D